MLSACTTDKFKGSFAKPGCLSNEIRKKIELLLKTLFLKGILDTRDVGINYYMSNFCLKYYKALPVKEGLTKSDYSSTEATPHFQAAFGPVDVSPPTFIFETRHSSAHLGFRFPLTSLCNHLGATQIQVYGITIILSQQCCLDKHFRVIGTELRKTKKTGIIRQ